MVGIGYMADFTMWLMAPHINYTIGALGRQCGNLSASSRRREVQTQGGILRHIPASAKGEHLGGSSFASRSGSSAAMPREFWKRLTSHAAVITGKENAIG